jgi:hypothetical protein
VFLSSYGVEPQILSEIEQERTFIAAERKFGRPTMRSIATHNEASILIIISDASVLIVALYLHYDDVGLPHLVLLVLKSLQHRLDRVTILALITFWVDLHGLYSFFDDWIVRQVEIQDNLYTIN